MRAWWRRVRMACLLWPSRPLHAFPNGPPSRLRGYETLEGEEGVYRVCDTPTGRSDESIVWGMEFVVASV